MEIHGGRGCRWRSVVSLRARACFAVVFILGAAGTALAQEGADHDSLAQAYTFHSRGLHHAAIKFFELALVSDPDNVEAHFTAAEAYRRVGDLATAVAHYRRVVELRPDSGPAREARLILAGVSDELEGVKRARQAEAARVVESLADLAARMEELVTRVDRLVADVDRRLTTIEITLGDSAQ